METPPKPQTQETRGRVPSKLAAIILLVVVVLVAGWGIVSRLHDSHSLKERTDEAAVPDVTALDVKTSPAAEEIALPGSVQAWHEAPIFARTSGYVKKWYTDIGTHVSQGQVLAEIDTPEIDAQEHQAEADLKSAQANNALAQSTARRWKILLKTKSVAQQDADEKIADANVKEAAVASARANLDRLRQLESFKHVLSPFDGVVTARNTDTGALINAGSASGAMQELFHVADLGRLRVYVQVPEPYTGSISKGLIADLAFAEHPGKLFKAELTDTAAALDPATRTLLVQFTIDNRAGALMPGGYTEVHLRMPSAIETVRLPVSALIFRKEGLQVAVVGEDDKVKLVTVTIARDFGKEVEINNGVNAGERVISNPPDSIADGETVRVIKPGQKDEKKGATDPKEEKEQKHDEKKEKSEEKERKEKDIEGGKPS